jgi:Ca-activated chloride channel family protein
MKAPSSDRCGSNRARSFYLCVVLAALCALMVFAPGSRGWAQEDELNKVHVPPPPPKPSNEPPAVEGKAGLMARPNERFRVNVNLVLIP